MAHTSIFHRAFRAVLVASIMGFFSHAAIAGLWDDERDAPPEKKVRKFLPGCHEFGHAFLDGQLVFEPVQTEEYDQTLFFLHNIYDDNITVKYNRTPETRLNPVWKTDINVNRWAAFATDQDTLSFNCYINDGDELGRKINCNSALEVCQYPRAKFGQNNKGNYWVTNNLSKKGTRNEAIRQGILLRW